MKEPIVTIERNGQIAAAACTVHDKGGFDPSALNPTIVPLYDLVGAYPLRLEEVPRLTYQSAIEFLARETSQGMPSPEKKHQELAGFLYGYEYQGVFNGCILVKRDDPVTRRRFSVAHELGHYILHFQPMLEVRERKHPEQALVLSEGLIYADDSETETEAVEPSGQLMLISGTGSSARETLRARRMEREANLFAAELLMPRSACQLLARRYEKLTKAGRQFDTRRSVLAMRLASEFLVSQEAMRVRLIELGLLKRGPHVTD
jgi:Zn-dependent peptidase ImmA (M78 family)